MFFQATLIQGVTLYLLHSRQRLTSQPAWYWHTLRGLGAVYVFVVSYRSIFPADYPHRYVFWDSMLSSILIHRSFAAVEELSWVLQILLIQTFCASCWAKFPVLCVSILMGLTIVTAECFSFTGTITQSFCWFAWEETCWAISFSLGFPVYLHLLMANCKMDSDSKGEKNIRFSGKDFAFVMTVFCLGYVPYMATVNVPSYWKDYGAQQLQGFKPNGFMPGIWNALTFREPTHDLSLWESSLLWKSFYFTLGPWLSMAMMTAPVPVHFELTASEHSDVSGKSSV